MTYEAGVVCHYWPGVGHRRFIVLTPRGAGPTYKVQQFTGPANHLVTEQLRDAGVWDAMSRADETIDVIQYLAVFCACMLPLLFFIPRPPKHVDPSAGH